MSEPEQGVLSVERPADIERIAADAIELLARRSRREFDLRVAVEG